MKRTGAYEAAALAKEVMAEIAQEREVVRHLDSRGRRRQLRVERRKRRLAPVAVSVFLMLQSANIMAPHLMGAGQARDGERYWELREELAVAVADVEAFAGDQGKLPDNLRSIGAQYDERWTYELIDGRHFRITASDGDIEIVHDSTGFASVFTGDERQARAGRR